MKCYRNYLCSSWQLGQQSSPPWMHIKVRHAQMKLLASFSQAQFLRLAHQFLAEAVVFLLGHDLAIHLGDPAALRPG